MWTAAFILTFIAGFVVGVWAASKKEGVTFNHNHFE